VALDRDRLQKIAGYLASPNDGERANAARMASDMLQAAGLTWAEVIRRAFANEPSREEQSQAWGEFRQRTYSRRAPQRHKTWQGISATHLIPTIVKWPNNWDRLSSWEQSFLRNVANSDYARQGLTDKQWEAVFGIAEKLGIKLRHSA